MEKDGAQHMVREATRDDLPHLLSMAQAFHEQQGLPYAFDRVHMAGVFGALIEARASTVLIRGQGFICGSVAPALSSPKWLSGFELLWWSEDGGGLRLMRGFEDWARRMGAHEVKFSHPIENERAGEVLTRKGHAPAEIIYTKRL